MRIYLAGPIKGKTYTEAVGWREYAAAELGRMGHITMSPMRGKEELAKYGPLNGSESDGSYPEFPLSSGHGLFRRDIFDVSMCDAILANLGDATELSLGTAMEIQRGYDLNKYVLTVLNKGSIHDHAFIHQASSLVVPTLADALKYIEVVGAPYTPQVYSGLRRSTMAMGN